LTEFISGDPLNAGVNWELISPNAGDAIISTSSELFPDGTTVLKAIFNASLTSGNRQITIKTTSKTDLNQVLSVIFSVIPIYLTAISGGSSSFGAVGTVDNDPTYGEKLGSAGVSVINNATNSGFTWDITGSASIVYSSPYAVQFKAQTVACWTMQTAYLTARSIADSTKTAGPFTILVS
jgi:hypothetical protein